MAKYFEVGGVHVQADAGYLFSHVLLLILVRFDGALALRLVYGVHEGLAVQWLVGFREATVDVFANLCFVMVMELLLSLGDLCEDRWVDDEELAQWRELVVLACENALSRRS